MYVVKNMYIEREIERKSSPEKYSQNIPNKIKSNGDLGVRGRVFLINRIGNR